MSRYALIRATGSRFNRALAVCEFAHGTGAHSRLYRFKFDDCRWSAAVTERNEYHRKALHCARTAEDLRDPGERAKLLEIARAYLGLARHVAERRDYDTARRPGEHALRPLEDA
jgi:hypothetical protein